MFVYGCNLNYGNNGKGKEKPEDKDEGRLDEIIEWLGWESMSIRSDRVILENTPKNYIK